MYGNTVTHSNGYGTTWGTSYRRSGVGATNQVTRETPWYVPAVLDTTITTPVEKVSQYALIGSGVGLSLGIIWMLAGNAVAPKNRAMAAALIALPVVGTIGGLVAAKQEYRG